MVEKTIDERDIEQWFEEFVTEMGWNSSGSIAYSCYKNWDGANDFRQFIIRKLGKTEEP